jgi:DNA-3-methyladenine glycosylase
VLEEDFFNRPVVEVARDLLGMNLCVRQKKDQVIKMTINETEAYDGEEDLACHASKGKTPRNQVMYGEPGVIYLYLCYGMHWLLNIVCEKKGYPAAVLLRGTLEVNGPGRLTKKLGIDGQLNRKRAVYSNGLWFEQGDLVKKEIQAGPRIGVNYAGEYWAKKHYRFWFSKPESGA